MTGDEDGSSGPQHLEAVQGERYRSITRGGMSWQQNAQGFGWGMTIRIAGTAHILMRATKPPTGELGLTRWARRARISHARRPGRSTAPRCTFP